MSSPSFKAFLRELKHYEDLLTEADNMPLTQLTALNRVVRYGKFLRELMEQHPARVADIRELLASSSKVLTRRDAAADALSKQLGQVQKLVAQAEDAVEFQSQGSSKLIFRAGSSRGTTKAADDLASALAKQSSIEMKYEQAEEQLKTAQEEHDKLITKHNKLITEHKRLIMEHHEAIVQATERFDRAKIAYEEVVASTAAATVAAAMVATATTTSRGEDVGRGMFSPLTLSNRADAGVSSHECATAKPIYLFVHNRHINRAVVEFQDGCSRNPAIASFQAPADPTADDASEATFATRLVQTVGPRLITMLAAVLNLEDISLHEVSSNFGVDLRLVELTAGQVATAVIMPIEAKRYFGTGQAGIERCKGYKSYRDSLPCLKAVYRYIGKRNTANIWYALTQVAYYIQCAPNSSNRGVVFSKDGVILVERRNDNLVLVGDIIAYAGTRPHPVAAIAYWVKESILSPCRTLASTIPGFADSQPERGPSEVGRSRPSAAGRSRPGRPPPGPSAPSGGRHGSGLRKRTRFEPQSPDDDDDDFQPEPSHKWKGKQVDAPTSVAARKPRRSSVTAVEIMSTRFSSYMETLGEFIDTSDAYLELVGSSRCGEVHTGKWSDGQAVVVKAAPVDNDELLHELSVEVQAYERLHDLQGTIVPRVIAHGHGNIEGKLVGILAIERIKDEEMLPAVDMDTRSTLMGLTNEERVRCTKALDAIHDRGVAHGDVRGANLLFRRSQEGGNALEPVFIDFGFSVFDTNAEAFQDTKVDDTYQLRDAFLGYCPYN